MTNNTPTPPWNLTDVFTPGIEGHACCSCCDGYCPQMDLPSDMYERPDQLWVTPRWVTDRFVAIDASMIKPSDTLAIDQVVTKEPFGDDPKWTGIESTAHFTGRYVARLLAAQIFIQEERLPDMSNLNAGPQSLWYRPDEDLAPVHVGWIMAARDQSAGGFNMPTISDVRRYQRIASERRPILHNILSTMGVDEFSALAMIETAIGAAALEAIR